MTIYDNQEWYDIPPTIEVYYRDRYNCPCQNRNCNLEIDSNKHGTLPGYQGGKCRCDDCRDARKQYNDSRKSLSLPEDDERHGTLNAYYNWNCRCDDCKGARLQKTEEKKKENLPDGDSRHGQVSSYVNFNCRCYPCKKSYNTWQREYRKRKKMAKKWYEASADDDFGISKREQSEMVGRAMGEHIWDKMEDIFGPIGLQSKLHTVTELEQRFPNHQIKIDEDDDPYVSHKVGDWEGRYFNGAYINMHHKKYGEQDGIHVGHDGDENKGNLHKLTENEFHNNIKNWISEYGPDYLAQYEPRPKRSSKWYLASEKVMPSSENNPWEMIPQDPDNIGPSPVNVDNSPCKCPDDRCKLTVDDPRHGTITGYSNKCKCRPCRDISLMYNRKKRGIDLDAPIIPLVDQQNVLDMIPKENIFNDSDDPRHGTLTGYNSDCKCDPCKNANIEYQKEYKLDKLQEMQNDPSHELHGTRIGYAVGCKCQNCIDAGNKYDRQLKLNKLQEMQNDPDHEFHGTQKGYRIGCKCKNCKDAASEYRKKYRKNKKNSSKWYHESSNGTCLNCGVPLSDRMDNYCGTCHNIMAQSEDMAYMQVNPRHPEARPFQKPHDFSGNE